jgi:hypothetical protein
MTEALAVLDIKFSEKRIHWIAQLYYIMPLPPFWDVKRKTNEKFLFGYKRDKVSCELDIHPAVHYLDSIVEDFRSTYFQEELEKDEIENIKKLYYYKKENMLKSTKYTIDACEKAHQLFYSDWNNKGKPIRVSCGRFWKKFWEDRKKGKAYYLNPGDHDFPKDEGKIVYKTEAMKREGLSSYVYYKPSGTFEEQKMEKYWENHMHKELAEKREAEEFVHFMRNWGDAKSRFESEIQRKMGQKYSGSQCEKRSTYYFDPKATRQTQTNTTNPRMMSAGGNPRLQSAGVGQGQPMNMTEGFNPRLRSGMTKNSLGKPGFGMQGTSSANARTRPATAASGTGTFGGTFNLRSTGQPGGGSRWLNSAVTNKEDFERKIHQGYYKD